MMCRGRERDSNGEESRKGEEVNRKEYAKGKSFLICSSVQEE